MSKKSSKRDKRHAWMNKELLPILKHKQEIHRRWKPGQVTCSDYREAVRVSRNETRKAKAHLELNLGKDVKDFKMGFFKYIGNKRKTKDNMDPLLNGGETLVTEDAEKAELLNAFFALAFTDKTSPQGSLAQEIRVKESWKEDFPFIKEDWVREHLGKLDIHKSMGPDRMHPTLLSKLVDIIARPLMIIFGRSWQSRKVPEDWKKANGTPVFKKELSASTAAFAKSAAMLGNSEDHTALSRALSQLAEVEEKIDQLHQEQVFADFYVFSELLGDYIRLIAAVKGVFDHRMKSWQKWQDAQVTLQKKREAEAKLQLANRPDKLQQAKDDIKEVMLSSTNIILSVKLFLLILSPLLYYFIQFFFQITY
ncbi:uncharacterized protein [Aphelocoma coerulescens]|uniref:uncharacterized protein n=1 Tax=Aphelocoma coerulescens TaxID=39617 RepID=UPI00360454C3